MKRGLAIILLLAFASGFAGLYTTAYAHGTGVSYEENKDGYKIDIGHDEFITEGEATRFDFTIYPLDINSVQGEVFTDAWINFSKDKKLFFAGGIHKPVFGTTGFTYVFPEPGTYTISARFQNAGETVVSSEFPIEVLAKPKPVQNPPQMVVYGMVACAGLLIGTGAGLFIPRKNNKIV